MGKIYCGSRWTGLSDSLLTSQQTVREKVKGKISKVFTWESTGEWWVWVRSIWEKVLSWDTLTFGFVCRTFSSS